MSDASNDLYRIGAELLESTEAIHHAIRAAFANEGGGDGDFAEIGIAYQRREVAFEALKACVESGATLDAATRTCVERVRSLDQEILAAGDLEATAIRDERNSLSRRRSVIQAHATRERSEPRVIAVKA